MKNHPRILNRTKEKKRSHYLGHLPFIHSTAKEKQAKAIIVVWVSVQRERKEKLALAELLWVAGEERMS
jgi:hypothetical protein